MPAPPTIAPASAAAAAAAPAPTESDRVQANRRATPRNAFTELIPAGDLRFGVVLLAVAVAAALGALHALEPGHGKTVVGAYLVGSRGTASHAVLLGLIVTASHTAGVYLLGGVTLFASRYVVPERIYPWLSVTSGLIIAGLGFILLRQRLRGGRDHAHSHDHEHGHDHGHEHPHDHGHGHPHGHPAGAHDSRANSRDLHHGGSEPHAHGRGAGHSLDERSNGEVAQCHPTDDAPHTLGGRAHRHAPIGGVSAGQLLAIGVSGGIVPCPAALVVLLSALALHRVGFGLLLIVAFSAGLATVLIAIGLLIVHARRMMARFDGRGVLVTRWLPMTSAAMITLLGVGMVLQTIWATGFLPVGRS